VVMVKALDSERLLAQAEQEKALASSVQSARILLERHDARACAPDPAPAVTGAAVLAALVVVLVFVLVALVRLVGTATVTAPVVVVGGRYFAHVRETFARTGC